MTNKILGWLQLGMIGGLFLTSLFGATFRLDMVIGAIALTILLGWLRANYMANIAGGS